MAQQKVLIVDDEKMVCWSLAETMKAAGYAVETASTGAEAVEKFNTFTPDLILLDISLPDANGIELLRRFKKERPATGVIMITADAHLDSTIKALQGGADDYVGKPFKLDHVEKTAIDTLERLAQRALNGPIPDPTKTGEVHTDQLVGSSEQMVEVFKLVKICGESDCKTVLVLGESGTGKELIAKAIHDYSARSEQPFIEVNCAAIPENLLENELFGHEKGAFTDASTKEKGIFESAREGIVFLDEIGDMPLAMQAKILKVIENRTFRRVGGRETLTVDVRIVAATNRDLPALVQRGEFRSDLYYRLNVLTIRLPPLRERRGCLPTLIDYFIRRLNAEYGKRFSGVSPGAMELMQRYPWPGNVRELRNAIERAVMLGSEPEILPEHLPEEVMTPWQEEPALTMAGITAPTSSTDGLRIRLPPGGITMSEVEMKLIAMALQQHDNNQTKAAQALGMSRDTLRYRMKKFGFTDKK
ncbi:MAG: sigma-54 dependent transcriptional regulator [Desulfuromonadaceae bacterium]|nr:sigma-54 dependent transcriptional regulator [Desulfuromonas sp.]MDY0184421.1 sigma-54 dependent transcriptional regulator [Desulfuromonadaceae bacterium]